MSATTSKCRFFSLSPKLCLSLSISVTPLTCGFDVVADITAYDAQDIIDLHNSLDSFDQYIMISSSAVYPEYGVQPFPENSERAVNKFWGKYGTDKIKAENALLERVPDGYILRPVYCGIRIVIFYVICVEKSGFSVVSVWFSGIFVIMVLSLYF